MSRKTTTRQQPSAPVERKVSSRPPLIFISHDSRDSELAEAFENLLVDASGGMLKAFRSSDRKGQAGIAFGAEWYATIMAKLGQATDVVALITSLSLDRPWILYEVGVARGKLDTPAFGVAFGVSLSQLSGPFAQLQNSADDEDSLTKLVLQLIRRNPDAEPREQAVRRQVTAFRERLSALSITQPDTATVPPDTVDVSKLFEEVKAMFRELPGQLRAQLYGGHVLSALDSSSDWVSDALRLLDVLQGTDASSRADQWSAFMTHIWDHARVEIDVRAYKIYRALLLGTEASLQDAYLGVVALMEDLASTDEPSRDIIDVAFLMRRAADIFKDWVESRASVVGPNRSKGRSKKSHSSA